MKISKPCIKCGKEANVGVFCDDCFLHMHELFKIDNITLAVCKCGSYWFSKQEKFDSLNEALEQGIKKRIKTQTKINDIKITIRKHFGHRYNVIVSATGKIHPCKTKKIEENETLVTVKNLMCENCARISGNYHEAKVQLRGKYLDNLVKKVHHVLPKNSWVKESSDGYDVFFVTKTDAANFVKQFKRNYKITKSFKIVSQKKDRVLARDVYVIR
ncbi:MAG: NMD3-related protein [Candidatus Aenigmatarchaeota archaeon]